MHGRTNAILHKETDKITGETLERILIQQPLPPITCLAIEGGGSACAAIAGGLEVLDETGISKGIEHESGISGGGIAALAHSLGYTGKEITHTFANMPMKKFSAESESWWFTPEPLANIRKVISAYLRINSVEAKAARDNLQAWLREMIALKMDGNGRATTRDLARKIREQKARNPEDNTYKSLYLGVVRYSPGLPTLIIFDLFNSPEIELAELGMMTACHPYLMGAHEWNGSLWGDGGMISVLLTKIFDKLPFLPQGYGFTELGVNPGVMVFKIDTKEEINQKVWGIVEDDVADTRMKVVKKMSVAALDNVNEHEIREARNVIALPDGGIDRMNLDQPMNVLMELVAKARDVTREYLEDYIDAAYSVEKRESRREWLNKCSLEELSGVLRFYKENLAELEEKPEEVARRDKLACVDPYTPSRANLQCHVDFFEKYINARARYDAAELAGLKLPEFHINIPPLYPKQKWHKVLRSQLESRLTLVQEKIKFADYEFIRLMKKWIGLMLEIMPHGFGDWRTETVQRVVIYRDYLEQLMRERDKIENKLGMKCAHHPAPDKHKSDVYSLFYSRMMSLGKIEDASSALRAVLVPCVKSLPVVDFVVAEKIPFRITLDFREERERNLYLIAALIYLKQRGYTDLTRFQELCHFYLTGELTPPVTVSVCMELLRQDAIAGQLSLYIIENLLHFFERKEYPDSEPCMDLNAILKLPSTAFAPPPSADLTLDLPEKEFEVRGKNDLQGNLNMLREKIQFAESTMHYLLTHFTYRLTEDTPQQFCHWRSVDAQKILIYQEWIRKLYRECDEIESRVNPHWIDNHISEVSNRKSYVDFYEKMAELKQARDLSYALSAVVTPSLPIVFYMNDSVMPISISLDMRVQHERRLYLIAALIYLNKRGYSDTPRFKAIVELFLPKFEVSGVNAAMLMATLDQNEAETQLSMLVIESLIHYFEKIEAPTYTPSIDLNVILGLPVASFIMTPDTSMPTNFTEVVYQDRQEQNWVTKANMIHGRLTLARDEYQRKLQYFSETHQSGELHGEQLSQLQYLIEHEAAIHKLEREHRESECRAGIACSHQPLVDPSVIIPYQVFYQKLLLLNNDKTVVGVLRAVLPDYLPYASFSDDSVFQFNLQLDMRKLVDRQLYLIAGLIYLEKRRCVDVERFKDIYRMTFPDETAAPTTREQIQGLLTQEAAVLEVSLFKIETLLHHFEKKQDAWCRPQFDIEHILSATPHSFFTRPAMRADTGRELPALFNHTGQTAPPDSLPSYQAESDDDEQDENKSSKGRQVFH